MTCDLWRVNVAVWLDTQANKSYSSIVRYVFPTCFKQSFFEVRTPQHMKGIRQSIVSHIKLCYSKLSHYSLMSRFAHSCRVDVDFEQSLFFLGPSSKTSETRKWPRAWLKARDGRGTTRISLVWLCGQSLFFLLGLPLSFLASRGFAAQRSRARALPLLNLKQKRDCSKSRIDDFSPACKNRESCKVDWYWLD